MDDTKGAIGEETDRCPSCGATAYYHYGRVKNGKKRRLCLVCNRQYTNRSVLAEELSRPRCPVCHEPMHVYRRESAATRYRCKYYPECKTFLRVENKEK